MPVVSQALLGSSFDESAHPILKFSIYKGKSIFLAHPHRIATVAVKSTLAESRLHVGSTKVVLRAWYFELGDFLGR